MAVYSMSSINETWAKLSEGDSLTNFVSLQGYKQQIKEGLIPNSVGMSL